MTHEPEFNLDDLKALEPLEAALKAQREYNAIDAEMKVAKKRREYTRHRLIARLEGMNRTGEGNEEGEVKLMRKMRNKITDFEALRDYVYGLDEPVSTYLKEVFIKGNKAQGIDDPLDRLIVKAAEQATAEGKSLEECMPPGLGVFNDISIRVTLSKNHTTEQKPVSRQASESKTPRYPDLDAALEDF